MHIRYPWVKSIYFQPKQGVLGDESLRIIYGSDGSLMYLSLILDKSTDSSALAFGMMERVVGYRRADTDIFGEAEAQAFKNLLAAGNVGNPEKGRMAGYDFPTNWHAPGGERYAPPGPPSMSAAPTAEGKVTRNARLRAEQGGQ